MEADFLLMYILKKPRSFLYSHPKTYLSEQECIHWRESLSKISNGFPFAYLTGHQPFWTLDLHVNKHTLIPRPDTEILIETALNLFSASTKTQILDMGTGTGAIALSIAKERPQWQIDATDKYSETLAIAIKNQKSLAISNIQFYLSDWFQALPNKQWDAIISNPPYIAANDPHLTNLQYEPQQALVSEEQGLRDLKHIIQNAAQYLRGNGFLLLEHGWDQQSIVIELLKNYQWEIHSVRKDFSGNDRIVVGQKK